MKKTITIFVAFIISNLLYGQENECALILKDGLYSYTKMTNTSSLNQDFRTYLLSEQFKIDIKNNKWGATIVIPLEDELLSLGANSSDEQYQNFRTKIINKTSFRLNQASSQVLISSIPNSNLAKIYSECVIGKYKFGFRVVATYGDDYANFIINY